MGAIGIIDYQMGNLASLANSLAFVGAKAEIVRDPEALTRYTHLILPGVGAFGDAMGHLCESGMNEALRAYARSGGFLMGVCLGMQVLFESSEESPGVAGLGLLPGRVERFNPKRAAYPVKIPHMGWNRTTIEHSEGLFLGVKSGERLYYVHAYHVTAPEAVVSARAEYGYPFVAAVARNRLHGIQPHPEKSHRAGLQILKNFTELK